MNLGHQIHMYSIASNSSNIGSSMCLNKIVLQLLTYIQKKKEKKHTHTPTQIIIKMNFGISKCGNNFFFSNLIQNSMGIE